jgi:hypothetical protein
MKVITSLAGASALCLAAPACKGGEGRPADSAQDRPLTGVRASQVADPAADPLSLVLDPDDEAFEHGAGVDGSDAVESSSSRKGKVPGRGPIFTVKGVLREADPASGRIVVDQLLAGGKRHDVRFWVDGETHVGWSKASMSINLGDLPPGITIYVTYHVVVSGGKKRNHALKVIIPGGMEDVAKMILDEPEQGEAGQKTPPTE